MSGGGGSGGSGGSSSSMPFALAGGIMTNAEFMQKLEDRFSRLERAVAETNASVNALHDALRTVGDISQDALSNAEGIVDEWRARIEKEGW